MNIIGFVPLRGGSKGIPDKNIKNFCGCPLFYWIVDSLIKNELNSIYISTNTYRVNELVDEYFLGQFDDKLFIHQRSQESADDRAHWETAVLELIQEKSLKDDDILVMAQVTSPFTQSHHIQEAFELYKSKDCKGSIVTCAKTHRFVWQKMGAFSSKPLNYDFRHRPRRQDFGGTLIENGAFCINTVGNLRRDKNRLSSPVSVYEMPEWTYTEIDNEDDWHYAEYLFKKYVLEEGSHK